MSGGDDDAAAGAAYGSQPVVAAEAAYGSQPVAAEEAVCERQLPVRGQVPYGQQLPGAVRQLQ